jgi:hypothetical protein
MDCLDAIEWLNAGESDPDVEGMPEAREAQRHFTDCPDCQLMRSRSREWDRSLAQVVPQVEIPAGLRARLLADIPIPAAAPSQKVAATRSRGKTRWRLAAFSASVAICLLLTATAFWWNAPPPLTLAELYAGVDVPYSALPAFDEDFEPRLPAAWSTVFTLDSSLIRGFPATGSRTGRAVLVPFQMTSRSGREPLRGRLLMLARDQLTAESVRSLPADFGEAEVRYLPEGRGAYVAWTEDDLVYVCLMSSGPADLHRFQRALTSLRSLT